MKLLNYVKPLGAFTNANQIILLAAEPKDRQEKKMKEEAELLVRARIERQLAYAADKAAKTGETVDLQALRTSLTPEVTDGRVLMPLQYLQDYMTRKIAAVQNNVSIHNTKEVAELREVFGEYGVELITSLPDLTFDHINWSARPGQKPKLMVHAADPAATPVVIRLEAASELCQKFMNAAMALTLKPGMRFGLAVEAVDPALEKNRRAGKKVADEGRYVNHNLTLSVAGKQHTGHPPQGTRFLQKPTLADMEHLFYKARTATSA